MSTTTAKYDGATGDYTIFTADGAHALLAGNCGMDEFHRLNNAIRVAEGLAERRALDQFAGSFSDFFEQWRRSRCR